MAASKTILYSVALNSNQNLVNAVHAEKGHDYFCPVCNGELILRKSGNTGKNAKRPHYAHKILTPNCTPETALHFAFKKLTYDLIKNSLGGGNSLRFSWECQYCSEVHKGDLLKKVSDVKLEYNLSECQPDIALLDSDGAVFAVIEVVVTHKPEEQVLKYYKNNGIILIQYNLIDDLDLYSYKFKIANPDIVNFCFNPKCKDCGHYLLKLKMMVIDATCYRCKSDMKCATVYRQDYGAVRLGSNYCDPDDFTQEEIAFARSKGVVLKERYSKMSGYKYLANVCDKCNAFVGNHYLFTDYIAQVGPNGYASNEYEVGYECGYCASNNEGDDLD